MRNYFRGRLADALDSAGQLDYLIVKELVALGPENWRRMDALFAMTGTAEIVQVCYTDTRGRTTRTRPPDAVLERVREQRNLSDQYGSGPWWRLMISMTSAGALEVIHDYGDDPFPDRSLSPARGYGVDPDTYPRAGLPIWLTAFVGFSNRQSRPADLAAVQARQDRAAQIRPAVVLHDFPPYPDVAARWAVLAAASVAVGAKWGPRIRPGLGSFETPAYCGSTLHMLPGVRAVLSGGVWEEPKLGIANHTAASPSALYAGAPDWVAEPVLNSRAARGLLTFCYWWENGRWYRAASPPAARLHAALPAFWSQESVAQAVSLLVAQRGPEPQPAAVDKLIAAAELGLVTREMLVAVCADGSVYDIDGALHQIDLAGLAIRPAGA